MRIASGTVDFSSTHLAAERSTRRESLRSWVGDRRPDFEALERGDEDAGPRPLGSLPGTADDVRSGTEGRALAARRIAGLARRLEATATAQARQSARHTEAAPKPAADDDDAVDTDAKTLAIKLIVEAMTGRKIKVIKLDDLQSGGADGLPGHVQQAGQPAAQQPQRVGWGVEYELHETYDEVEQTSFAAEGVVKTADGQEISFTYELDMQRQFHAENHVSVRAGDALLKDPLVINFGGTAAQFTSQTYEFDLDADGTKDNVAWVMPGSGFLALDKNGDGKINDGSELFGAKTGDGFAELAAYDDDKNGWIDEADAAYGQLQVWSKNGNTDQVSSLKERNVGAIYLGKQATPFELKTADNELQGAVRASGIYVKEDGSGVGSVQQIDLAI